MVKLRVVKYATFPTILDAPSVEIDPVVICVYPAIKDDTARLDNVPTPPIILDTVSDDTN